MNKLALYVRGILMGICDVIPGVSGGTMAFITGIYYKLIESIKGFSPELAKDLLIFLVTWNKKSWNKLKIDIKKIDLVFLGVLGAGIVTAVLLGSRLIKYLLDNHFAYTISFFVGLIIASIKIIYDDIKDHSTSNIISGIVGIFIGVPLAFISPAPLTPSLPYYFVSGFLAASAMFLPGISGAYILYLLGVYDFMLLVVHNIFKNFAFFVIFMIGVGLGAATISRIISFIFKKNKYKTLYILMGLVLGSLVLPIKQVYASTNAWNPLLVLTLFGFLITGLVIVLTIIHIDKKKRNETRN